MENFFSEKRLKRKSCMFIFIEKPLIKGKMKTILPECARALSKCHFLIDFFFFFFCFPRNIRNIFKWNVSWPNSRHFGLAKQGLDWIQNQKWETRLEPWWSRWTGMDMTEWEIEQETNNNRSISIRVLEEMFFFCFRNRWCLICLQVAADGPHDGVARWRFTTVCTQ